jgi:hypothetical protein
MPNAAGGWNTFTPSGNTIQTAPAN